MVTEKAISVLILCSDSETLYCLSRALRAVGCQVQETNPLSDLRPLLRQQHDLLVVDRRPFASGAGDAWQLLQSQLDAQPSPVLYLVQHDKADQVALPGISVLPWPTSDSALMVAVRALITPDAAKRFALQAPTNDVMSEGLVTVDEAGVVKGFNCAASQMFGYQQSDILGHSVTLLMPELHRSAFERTTDGSADTAITLALGQLRMVSGQHKDGSIFLLEVASSEIILDGRRYFMVIVGNTATRAQLTKQSREAEVRLSEFARIAHVGGWFWDMGERVVLTEETYRIYGVNQADFVPTLSSVVALIHPDDQPYVGKWITDAVAGIHVREINYRLIRPDGEIRYLAGLGEMKRDELGQPVEMRGTVRDITDAKLAAISQAQALQALEDIQSALDEHAIVARTDPAGRLTYVNDKFVAISKYARDELIGQTSHLLSSLHHPKEYFVNMWQTVANGGVWKGEIKNRASDGSFYWTETTLQPFFDENRKPTQFIAIGSDITARKVAEAELKQARLIAEHANEAKDAFLATMSHEIRTPLGGMLGMLELLAIAPLTGDEQNDLLKTAQDSGRGLLRIVNDILDWSKITEGKLDLAPVATSAAYMMRSVINMYMYTASVKRVRLSSKVDPRLSEFFMVDALRLAQVLNNFVSNAIKFSEGGQVDLRAELIERFDGEGAERVCFSVTDTGIGISAETQARLFQNYGQASADTARMYGGTGLGLAICKRLADLLGGQINLQSTPGEGSIFSITLTLPVVADTQGNRACEPEMKASTGLPLTAAKRTTAATERISVSPDAPLVLVVDDNSTNRKLLAHQLKLLGYRSEVAEDGQIALSYWQQRRHGLVITDCHMPVMDGYGLTRAIRALEAAENAQGNPKVARTLIFAWTANAMHDEVELCRTTGMDELLIKPVVLAQVSDLLSRHLPLPSSTETIQTTPPQPPTPTSNQTLSETAASLAMTYATLDVSVLVAMIGDDPADIDEFFNDFRVSVQRNAEEIHQACEAGNFPVVCLLAHRLKSSARSVGALSLGELCAALELAGESAQRGPVDALLVQFDQELLQVLRFLLARAGGQSEPEAV